MKQTLTVLSLLLLGACGGSSGGDATGGGMAPVITQFTLESPIKTTASAITGSVHAADPVGLTGLSANVTITSPELDSMFSVPISGGTVSETAQTIPLLVELESTIPAGTYHVTITLTESGATSNSLESTVVVQE
jgi:hypothetical protein